MPIDRVETPGLVVVWIHSGVGHVGTLVVVSVVGTEEGV